jgi:hypothetical protein
MIANIHTHTIAKAVRARIIASVPRAEALHLKQYSGPGRTAFLSAVATRVELVTSPAVFRLACRNLLYCHLRARLCGLCGMTTTSPFHYIDCHNTRSQERLFLHNCIRKLIERLARVAGGQYRTEPLLDDGLHRSRRGDTSLSPSTWFGIIAADPCRCPVSQAARSISHSQLCERCNLTRSC